MSRHASVSVKVLKDIDPKALDRLRQRLVDAVKVVNVGVPAGRKEKDGTPVAMVAAVHEFGSPSQGIPERPFLRVSIEANKPKYAKISAAGLRQILRGKSSTDAVLAVMGEAAVGDVKQRIRSGDFTPLKPATIKRKGSSRPLIDTGQMEQSIAWELGDKNHD